MIPEGNQNGHKVQDDLRVDQVDLFPYGVGDPSAPGAEDREELKRACAISSFQSGTAEGFFLRQPLLGWVPLGGKK